MQIRTRKLVWSAAGLLAVGAATGLSAATLLQSNAAVAPDAPAAGAGPSSGPAHLIPQITTPNYRAIVAQNQAAVVGITTAGDFKTSAESGSDSGGANEDDPLAQLFHGRPTPRRHGLMHGQGSGFVISADGLVLTNAHVVEGAKEVTVKLSDHREFKAKVLGSDKSSDIAVLKIAATDLHFVQLGNSDQLGVGDYVLAIGEPFGLEETATAGIVSAKGRSLPGDGYVPFIQTDAAVNPGNSGGPLFDANGAVVGINSQIYSNSGAYQGVSFAIPINLAVQIKDQIVKTGKVAHARLGVQVQTVDQSLADSFKLTSPNGALVAKIEPDSAAAQAGLKVGDVILKVNGNDIVDAGQLSARIGATAPGDKASLDVWRGGKVLTLTATVGTATQVADAGGGNVDAPGRLGLAVRPLNPQERREAGVPGGLVVEDAQGRAAEAGIQRGDVVLSVDGTLVDNAAQLRKMVEEHGNQIALLIQRGESRVFVPVTLG
jgi:serine protease Do